MGAMGRRRLPARAAWALAAGGLMAAAGCATAGGMAPASAAGDSVSIGYGTLARRDVAGAVQSIVIPKAIRQRYSRVEDLLVGRVPGLQVIPQPDGGYALRLRGTTSLMGNNEPLIVINGMPAGAYGEANLLAGISPLEVERIDVLKDGETAIYGQRGAAGVILITTVRGRPRGR